MGERQERKVPLLGQDDPLEKEMATHSSTLALKILWTEKPGSLQSMGSQSQTQLSDSMHMYLYHWKRNAFFTVIHIFFLLYFFGLLGHLTRLCLFSSPCVIVQHQGHLRVVFLLLFSHCHELFATPWIAACQAPLSPSLYKFMSIKLVIPFSFMSLFASLCLQ